MLTLRDQEDGLRDVGQQDTHQARRIGGDASPGEDCAEAWAAARTEVLREAPTAKVKAVLSKASSSSRLFK